MSWPAWSAAPASIPAAMAAAPVQSTLLPAAINSAPAVMPPSLQYSPEQWAQAQQQNWQQWAQWQQQYQQWHQQYGAEYQKSMSAIQSTLTTAQPQPPLPAMPNTGVPPPLPIENKPPLPPEDPPVNQPSAAMHSYSTLPPKPVQQAGYSTAPPSLIGQQQQQPPQGAADSFGAQRQNWQPGQQFNQGSKRPYAQPAEHDNAKRPMMDKHGQWAGNQRPGQWPNNNPQPAAPALQKTPNVEELSEAEKKFDKEFAAWEAQFNKWKEQNANHPDKTQYMEYEKKWESWRNSLLERREQMRRKRVAMVAAAAGNKPQGQAQQHPSQFPHGPQHASAQSAGSQHTPQQSGIESATYKPLLGDNLAGNPPPHQNNEPLSFKPPARSPFAVEDVPDNPGEGFLKSSVSSGGIPGLDLVKDNELAESKEDVIELDKEERLDKGKDQSPPPSKSGPDLDAISKGINTILGDQKLLSMLSMVSQNPPSGPPPNIATDTTVSNFGGRPAAPDHSFNAPPPPLAQQPYAEGNYSVPPPHHQFDAPPPYNDHSNHSFDDRSNHGDNYQQRESVNNFDDQTRSSFTMGSNDQDVGYGRNQGGKFPPARLGPDGDRNRGNFGPNLADNRGKFGPGRDFGAGNFPQDSGSFRGRAEFGRPGGLGRNDSFGRDDNYDSFPRGDNSQRDKFGYDDGPNRPANNFRQGNFRGEFDDANRGGNNFDDHRDNFRSDNFNQRPGYNERFGSGSNYNRQPEFDDYENYNDEDDYEKYHSMFNDEDEDRRDAGPPPQNMGRGPARRNIQGGPPAAMMMDIAPPMRMDRPPPPRMDQPPPPRMNQGPPGMDEAAFARMEQGPPPRIKQEPPPRMDQGGPPPLRGVDQGPPPQMMDAPMITPEPPSVDGKIFEPASVIDYDHKPQRPIEPEVVVVPVNMFDYRHKPLNRIPFPQRPRWLSESVKFIREFDPLAPRAPPHFERPPPERYPRDSRRDEWQPDGPEDRYGPGPRGREFYDERDRRFADDYEPRDRPRYDWGRPESGRYGRRRNNGDDAPRSGSRGREDFEELSDGDLNDDLASTGAKNRQENRLERSNSRSPLLSNPPNPSVTEITMIEDVINPPGRFNRPPRIVIILRGPPGSGKTYLAKIIKDKEVEHGGSAPRILSLDDYFMVEHEKDVIEDGKVVKVKEMIYEYEAEMEESYRASFVKFFKKTITDGYFPFIIVDNVNDKVKYFGEMWSFAKQNGFQVYICQMDLDPVLCTKRNVHNRNEAEIEECIAGWEPTPAHHPTIDASGLLQSSCVINEVEMEEAEQPCDDSKPDEAPEDEVRSKWDTFDCSSNNLAKLDGVSKPLRPSRTMEEYLQLEDNWEISKPTKPGQKRVRWADLEEQREQKKMRALGFIVGHTNWERMMDPTEGGSALTQTRYIDRVSRY